MLFSLRDTGFHAKKRGNAPLLDRMDEDYNLVWQKALVYNEPQGDY